MPTAEELKQPGEKLTERVVVYYTPSQMDYLSKTVREDLSAYVRNKTFEDLKTARLIDAGLENFRAKYVAHAPCGPWEEALEQAGEFVLSKDIADELEAREGDVIVRAVGESMEGRGVIDGALLLMRPLPEHRTPMRGEIALVQINYGGEYLGTIKEWCGGSPIPKIVDGEGEVFKYPGEIEEVRAIAVARGIVGRL